MIKSKLIALLVTGCGLMAIPYSALAHPVAYQGALGIMWTSQPGMTGFEAVYSVTNRYALGVNYFWTNMSGQEQQYVMPRLNFLIKRWNGSDSQANIYASIGAGAAQNNTITRGALLAAVEADYETRHFYTSAKAMTIQAAGLDDLTVLQYRIGIAPYIVDFDGFHTWAILQTQYFPHAADNKLRVGPMLRFFYKNVLWEVGVTTNASWNFNAMIHF